MVFLIVVVEIFEIVDVELLVGNDGFVFLVEVIGIIVVMMIGGSLIGEIVNLIVVDFGGLFVVDEKFEELIEVLVVMGGFVVEKICEVEVLIEIEVILDFDVEVREVERLDEEVDVVDRDFVIFVEELIEFLFVVIKEE